MSEERLPLVSGILWLFGAFVVGAVGAYLGHLALTPQRQVTLVSETPVRVHPLYNRERILSDARSMGIPRDTWEFVDRSTLKIIDVEGVSRDSEYPEVSVLAEARDRQGVRFQGRIVLHYRAMFCLGGSETYRLLTVTLNGWHRDDVPPEDVR